MVDLDTYRRRIGCFSTSKSHRKTRKKRSNHYYSHNRRNTANTRGKEDYSHHFPLSVCFLLIVSITLLSVWTPNDARSAKNRQRPTFQAMEYETPRERNLFTSLRGITSKLTKAKSHLDYFLLCKREKVYPRNLVVSDHLQVAFTSPLVTNKLKALNNSHILERIDACIAHYKAVTAELRESERIARRELQNDTTAERFTYLEDKNQQFAAKLCRKLKATKEKKANKLLENAQPEEKDGSWVPDLGLNMEHRKIIEGTEWLNDTIIGAALSLLQKQYPAIMTQPPALYRANGYVYSPCETVQIAHNDSHHWLLLSSLGGIVTIYDSLNMKPTESLMKQMKQLFSPDNSIPAFQQKTCHKQNGSDDCGVFAIAYAVGMFNGIEPDKIIYDQSKNEKPSNTVFRKTTVGSVSGLPTNRQRTQFTQDE